MAEGPVPVGPQQFYAPKALIAKTDNLELVQQRFVVDEAKKGCLGRVTSKVNLLGQGRIQGMIYLDMG